MLIIYGLGNNEPKYLQTKHNAGRFLLEVLVKKLSLEWEKHSEFIFCKTNSFELPIYFLYSSGYMNNSGQVLFSFINYFKLKSDPLLRVLILHDDSDQQENNIKLVCNGGSGGHKGIDSIYQYLLSLKMTTEQIWRLKIGVRPPQNKHRSETFVLSKLKDSEIQYLIQLSDRLYQYLGDMVQGNFVKVQNDLNTKI